MNGISIVVPTLNEAENIPVLLQRIADSLASSTVAYEVIFVDDHSTDGTTEAIQSLTSMHPITLHAKEGARGKAFSLLQGFNAAQYDVICMIDADLQYPPEAILPMYDKMETSGTDMILTTRDQCDASRLRKLSSRVFNYVFTRLLFGFNYDSQSGLKLFKTNVVRRAKLDPSPWSFDLEFIIRALENNFKILTHPIPFSARHSGETKVRVVKVAYELAKASLKLRFKSSPRKLKKAYRINLQFAQRVAGIACISLLGILGTTAMSTPVQALTLPVDFLGIFEAIPAVVQSSSPVSAMTSQSAEPQSPELVQLAPTPPSSAAQSTSAPHQTARQSGGTPVAPDGPTSSATDAKLSAAPSGGERMAITYPNRALATSDVYGASTSADTRLLLWPLGLAAVSLLAASVIVLSYNKLRATDKVGRLGISHA